MPLACVLQHIRCEPPGLFSGPLRDRGFTVETVETDEGGRLPDWREAGLGPVPCLAQPGQQHELTITRQCLATVNKRGAAMLVRRGHLPNAARQTYSRSIVSCK